MMKYKHNIFLLALLALLMSFSSRLFATTVTVTVDNKTEEKLLISAERVHCIKGNIDINPSEINKKSRSIIKAELDCTVDPSSFWVYISSGSAKKGLLFGKYAGHFDLFLKDSKNISGEIKNYISNRTEESLVLNITEIHQP